MFHYSQISVLTWSEIDPELSLSNIWKTRSVKNGLKIKVLDLRDFHIQLHTHIFRCDNFFKVFSPNLLIIAYSFPKQNF